MEVLIAVAILPIGSSIVLSMARSWKFALFGGGRFGCLAMFRNVLPKKDTSLRDASVELGRDRSGTI